MARLIKISFQPHNAVSNDGRIRWEPCRNRQISTLPQLVWEDGTPWREANIFALHRAQERVDPATVESNLSKILPYANFLELEKLDWLHFPKQKSERCLIRYRGFLVKSREQGDISPAEASHRMRVAIRFYRFLQAEGLIDPEWKLWKERRFSISTFDAAGFERTLHISTTDLSIPNRRRKRLSVEDGLQPLSENGLRELVRLAKSTSPYEFFLMLLIGCISGLLLEFDEAEKAIYGNNVPRKYILPFYGSRSDADADRSLLIYPSDWCIEPGEVSAARED